MLVGSRLQLAHPLARQLAQAAAQRRAALAHSPRQFPALELQTAAGPLGPQAHVHEHLERRVAQLAQRPLDARPGREPAVLSPFHPHRPLHVRNPCCSVSHGVLPPSDEWGRTAL